MNVMKPDLDVTHFAVRLLQDEEALHEVVKIRWGNDHEVEVTVSPSGRSVRIYQDGVRMLKEES